ncbi:Tautomerase enzyme [compost metagenome]
MPLDDLFQRVLALGEADFRFNPRYPDLSVDRTPDFALVEILWSAGRSVKVKRALLGHLMASLDAAGVQTEHVMVCFKETTWENWSFGGGRLLHA